MKAYNLPLFIILFFLSLCSFAQVKTTYQKTEFAFSKYNTVNVATVKPNWNVKLLNLENSFEGNKAYEESIQKIKKEAEQRFPRKNISQNTNKTTLKTSPDTCVIIKGFEGNLFVNSTPNDNTLAVNNNGMLISDINSSIYIYDTQNDTLLKTIPLSVFSDTLTLNSNQYDPKLLYDPSADKFVMTYLSGTQDSTSNIVLAFSQTNDPLGLWNLYSIPGNPLSDTSWTDFPAIALSQNELFITVNLIEDTGSWQTAFKQSIIWQIDKNKGYNGDTLLTKLWSQIKTGDKPIRNIHPIQGGSALTGSDMYLLSDRNFAVQSDTVFMLHITNVISDINSVLTITPVVSDKCYGMPPDALQPGNQTFATNDARVLGGFIENDKIQFVGNSMDTLTGKATVYHGIINNVSTTPSAHLTLMSDTLELGYPNIAYTGVGSTDNSSIISVNYTGKFTNPGFAAFNYNGITGIYSSLGNLKSSTSYVNLFSGPSAERWGDYSGSQRVYNQPGKVWVAGSFGKKLNSFTRVHGTWIAQLQKAAPDAGIEQHSAMNANAGIATYPNPVSDLMFVELSLPFDTHIDVCLFDVNGRLVKMLMQTNAKQGKNLLSFSTQLLSQGVYLLTVKDDKQIFLTKKIVKE